MKRIFLIIIALTFFATGVYGADSVDVRVLDEFDKADFRKAVHISSIKTHGIVRLWCWIEVKSDTSNIERETYYIELGFDDGSGRRILSDYNKEPKIFAFERPVNKIIAYYWLAKRIWTSNEGTYDFTVYTLKDGQKRTVGMNKVTVEDQP